MRDGRPVLAAACELAVEEDARALRLLLQGHELEAAALLCSVADFRVEEEDAMQVHEMVGRRLEQAEMYDAAKAAFDRCGGSRAKNLYEQMVFRMSSTRQDDEVNEIYRERLQTDLGALAAEADALVAQPRPEEPETMGAHILKWVRTATLARKFSLAVSVGTEYLYQLLRAGMCQKRPDRGMQRDLIEEQKDLLIDLLSICTRFCAQV